MKEEESKIDLLKQDKEKTIANQPAELAWGTNVQKI